MNNTLVQGCLAATNDFQFNCRSESVFNEENHVFGYKLKPGFKDFSIINGDESLSEGVFSDEICAPTNGPSPSNESSLEGVSLEETDYSDAVLKFISQMLMEEGDLENKPCMLHDCLALQATEKSLYDVLNNNLDENSKSPNDHFTKTSSISSSETSPDISSFLESNWSHNMVGDFESLISPYPYTLQSDLLPFGPSNGISDAVYKQEVSSVVPFRASNSSRGSHFGPKSSAGIIGGISPLPREKKNRYREGGDIMEEHRSNKQFANNLVESEPLEMYDEVLLCPNLDNPACGEAEQIKGKKKSQKNEQPKGSNRGRPRGGKKQGVIKEVVDLTSLLMQCAQAVGSYDNRTVNDLLTRIRQHASPQGDGTERVAHYFANALEARLVGSGTASYAFSMRISAAEMLRGYEVFIKACPFSKMSNLFANKTINKLATGATTLHIIDFGILYGFQWPCIIQILSERPGGPPKLRITGIDFPQPGFRPADRVEDTGRRLAKYCERFRVPFEYIAIAQKWETIKLEDLKIQENELVVVNSLYRLQNVPDETVMVNSPRDAVLNLIKKINPDMFIHGVINATFNTPFFVTRFREALFHFSSMFDMFEATLPREDKNRLLFEEEVFGKDAMNIIACEGTERINRPETYKQWHVRNLRAGFRQLPLDQELVKYVRNKVKADYHKDFLVDEDGMWMLQGCKGRVVHAISYWKPAQE